MQQLLQRRKPSPEAEEKAIERGTQLEELIKHPGWAHVERFMEDSRSTAHLLMERDVAEIRRFTMLSLFGHYLRYLAHLFENRAYNKMKGYVNVSITKGKQASERRRKREAAKKSAE